MVEKSWREVVEFYVPENGLDLEPYIVSGDLQAVHHLARYYWAIRVLKHQAPGTILDIATGAGYGAYLMAKNLQQFTIIGGDYDARAVRYAKHRYQTVDAPNLSFQQFDIVRWRRLDNGDTPAGSFDYI